MVTKYDSYVIQVSQATKESKIYQVSHVSQVNKASQLVK